MDRAIKNTITLILSIMFLVGMIQTSFAASFQNGDFETGDFQGWSGDLISSGIVAPNSDSHFSIIPNAGPANSNVAQLQNDNTDWIATLYQDFTLDSMNGPGWSMDINFWVQWSPTDEFYDGISVTLGDLGGNTSLDLLAGISNADLLAGTWVTQDITSFAQTYGGQDVELAFTITDWDWYTPDYLKIDNISIQQHAPGAPVPEPATMTLLGIGLVGLVGVRRRFRV